LILILHEQTASTPRVAQCGRYGAEYGLPRNNYCGDSRNAKTSRNNWVYCRIKNILLHGATKKVIAIEVVKDSQRKIFNKQTLVGNV
jgi:hypothetical protein